MKDDTQESGEGAIDGGEFELDAEGAEEDLEEAMREALKAVEGDGGDGETAGADGGGVADEGDGASQSASPVIPQMAAREVQAELAELRERSVRTLADFDNYRKRVERERGENRRYAGFEVIREFLPIVDNLERALGADAGLDDMRQGIELILRQIRELLRRHGVERVAAVGEAFDPAVHDAVSKSEAEDVEVATVSQELQAGYKMHERLVRPATVIVVMPADRSAGKGGNGEGA